MWFICSKSKTKADIEKGLLFLLIVILIMAVGDLLWSSGEEVWRLDLTDGAGQLVAFTLHVS